MKIKIIILVLFLTTSLGAQKNEINQRDLFQEYNISEIDVYSIGPIKKDTLLLEKRVIGGKGEILKKYSEDEHLPFVENYIYENDNLVRLECEGVFNPDTYQLDTLNVEYKYNDENKLVSELWHYKSEKNPSIDYNYFYNGDRMNQRQVYDFIENQYWLDTFIYNVNNQLELEVTIVDNGKKLKQEEFPSFNETLKIINNNLNPKAFFESYAKQPPKGIDYSKYFYENNSLIKKEDYSFVNYYETYHLMRFKTYYEYDDRGLLIKESFYEYSSKEPSTTIYYQYKSE